MVNKENGLEANILELLISYQDALESGESEIICDNILDLIEDIAPNSDFNDMMFHGEKDRSFEEIAREVSVREGIFAEQGAMGVYERILSQMNNVLEFSSVGYVYRRNAQRKREELLEFMQRSTGLQ